MTKGAGVAKRIVIESLGWVLVLGGIAALVLPGPGLLMLAGGLALLSQQYEWAERRLDPLKQRALQAAADNVETVPRIFASSFGAGLLLALGAIWTLQPDVPGWWPLADSWWLPGGWATGVSLVVSGLVAAALIVYSVRNFREIKAGDPTP